MGPPGPIEKPLFPPVVEVGATALVPLPQRLRRAWGAALQQLLATNPLIENLDMGGTSLTVPGLQGLVEGMKDDGTLKVINVSFNDGLLESEEGVAALRQLLGKNPQIETLDIGSTGLTVAGLRTFSPLPVQP